MRGWEILKVKVATELFVSWVKMSLQEVNNKALRKVCKTFQKCGLDPYDNEKIEMARWLQSCQTRQFKMPCSKPNRGNSRCSIPNPTEAIHDTL